MHECQDRRINHYVNLKLTNIVHTFESLGGFAKRKQQQQQQQQPLVFALFKSFSSDTDLLSHEHYWFYSK